MKKKSKVLYNVIFFVIAVALALVAYKTFIQDEKYYDIYRDAETLIEKEDYAGALELLESIKEEEHLDTLSLIELCIAHEEYDSGDFYAAYNRTLLLEWEYQSAEQMEEIEEFTHQLEMECVEFIEQELDKEQAGDTT